MTSNNEKEMIPENTIRKVGDLVARVVLGECRISRVTQVEGLPNYPFYRTEEWGCFSYKEGLLPPIQAQRQAIEARKQFVTVVPHDLEDRITVEYNQRSSDGKVTWAQIGIYQGMLFWKEYCTYQFLESFKNEKELKKAYKKHKDAILNMNDGYLVEKEHEMRRLYKSNSFNGYSDAEYVQHNK